MTVEDEDDEFREWFEIRDAETDLGCNGGRDGLQE